MLQMYEKKKKNTVKTFNAHTKRKSVVVSVEQQNIGLNKSPHPSRT